jgi:hypothetical protein
MVGRRRDAGAALARGGLLAAALRTGRARSRASGSPQGWPLFGSRGWSGWAGSRPGGGSGFIGCRPRRRDAVAPVAVAGHRHLAGPVEPRAVGARPVAPPVPSLDLFPGQPRVFLAQPQHHSPPEVVVEVAEAALGRGVAVVVGPTPQDRVERVDELVEREADIGPAGQLLLMSRNDRCRAMLAERSLPPRTVLKPSATAAVSSR